ncbi:quinoprotein dehydrogenase-associated putative ABC transporter substrate-binding protein [Candidatus Spongiihabitans sp.]|uniref:quinoprotein dehydrogenase-associated putative ABC transporter substrate-binding protein n=1 Tax=Candidatus Spongiihabitans sp. TaxID=3101308 RepID=UPI003C6EB660
MNAAFWDGFLIHDGTIIQKTIVRKFGKEELARLAFIMLAVLTQGMITSISDAEESTAGREALSTRTLRVCADPNNLPYSNDKGEGFENKIAELLSAELGLPIQYTWFPQSFGFIRKTLKLRRCDLVIGIATTSELVQNTNPYYHSVYSMVFREDSGINSNDLKLDKIKEKKFGVVAGTPPASLLAKYGLMRQVKPYLLVVDTRLFKPAKDAVADVLNGETDVAMVWGPLAGYYVQQFNQNSSNPRLVIAPMVHEDNSIRLDFTISMAVRKREYVWKHKINLALAKLQPAVDQILGEYGVPLVDKVGE